MRRLLVFLFLSLLFIFACARSNVMPQLSSFSIGAIFDNPSLSTNESSNALYLSVMPSKFGLSELNENTLGALIKLSPSISSISLIRGSYSDLYSKLNFEQSIAGNITNSLSLAISFCADNLKIKNYSSKYIIFSNISANYKLFDSTILAFKFYNINGAKFSGDSKYINQNFQFDFSYPALDFLYLNIGGVFRLDDISSSLMGVKFNLIKSLSCNLAYMAYPSYSEIGVEYSISDKLKLFFNTNYMQPLGFSHSISLAFAF